VQYVMVEEADQMSFDVFFRVVKRPGIGDCSNP